MYKKEKEKDRERLWLFTNIFKLQIYYKYYSVFIGMCTLGASKHVIRFLRDSKHEDILCLFSPNPQKAKSLILDLFWTGI